MKCEICHKADAETAITREGDGGEEELYVCNACAKKEMFKEQRLRQRTRAGEDGEGDEPPPFLGALINAFEDFATGLQTVNKEIANRIADKRDAKWLTFPTDNVTSEYRFCNRLHLEGLHLIGELEPVIRGVKALKMDLVGVSGDGIFNAGNAYNLSYTQQNTCARHIFNRIIAEERNARLRLLNEMPRVLADAICRALALLKNCRLLAPGELVDLLSPIYIAAHKRLLIGITPGQITRLVNSVSVELMEDRPMPSIERDELDARRADKINRMFTGVMLNDDAEGRFLNI